MCLILDANIVNKFRQRDEDTLPIWDWLDKKRGRIIYADGNEHFEREWFLHRKKSDTYQFWTDLQFANKFKNITEAEMEKSGVDLEKILENEKYTLISKAKDRHLIVAAIAGKAKRLASMDRGLGKDLAKIIKDCKIYKNKTHKRLLEGYECP